jgi:D-alanyl-D-alanine carboxypeptidase
VPSHRADAPPPLKRIRAQQRQRAGRMAARRARGSSLSVQHVGIAGALGFATIAAPISGLMSAPSPVKADLNEISTPHVAAPAFPFVMRTSVERLTLVPGDTVRKAVPQTLAAPRNLLVTRPSRGRERAVLPGCSGEFTKAGAANGRLPSSMLCTLWDRKYQLRADAAISLAKLNVAYTQEFGHALCLRDAYRSLNEQYAVKASRGWFAATPGTSTHGLGRAVDLCDGVERFGTPTYRWMVENAPRYGWEHPEWAEPGGSGPTEPWHWEFPDEEEDQARNVADQ